MSTPRKLNVYMGFPSYGGNGGISSEVPDIREWAMETILKMKSDERIGEIHQLTMADTPITMVRNKFISLARQVRADVLLMVDSDQSPNKHKGESWFKPFWDTSFDFLYGRYDEGPVCVGAPYCGPPGGTENCYIFYWENFGVRGDETPISLEQYGRYHASTLAGIQPVAALPTGLIIYDMRCFDLIQPPYFKYEWKNEYEDEKASTEDVYNTREISLCGQRKLGYNPVYCNFDSWIGHWKPWNVGKPQPYTVENISENFRRACEQDRRAEYKEIFLPEPNGGFPRKILQR